MCKDTKFLKNTCFRDLKEILYGLRPEVGPVEKNNFKTHRREARIPVNNVILIVCILVLTCEDVCSVKILKSFR